jgi:hypothetical protein
MKTACGAMPGGAGFLKGQVPLGPWLFAPEPFPFFFIYFNIFLLLFSSSFPFSAFLNFMFTDGGQFRRSPVRSRPRSTISRERRARAAADASVQLPGLPPTILPARTQESRGATGYVPAECGLRANGRDPPD